MPSIDEAATAKEAMARALYERRNGSIFAWDAFPKTSLQRDCEQDADAALLALSRSKIDDDVIEAAVDAYHRADRKGADDAVVIRAALTAALAKLAEKEG